MPIDREKTLQAAQTLVEKKKFDKAIIEYRKLVAETPSDVRTLLKIGDLHLKLNQHEGAISTYEQVGDHYFREGFAVKAIAVYKQIRGIITRHCPNLESKYSHILPRLAGIYTQLGLTSDALAAYDEVAANFRQDGRERDALDVFKKVIELDPENPIGHLRVADSRVRLGDIDKAVEAFGLAANIMLKLGRDDDALKVLERLLEHRPEPTFARLCGLTYLNRGRPGDGMIALSRLQIAFKADARDLETLGVLVRAFDAINQPKKAVEVLKEAARIARDSEDDEEFARLVERLQERAPNDPQVRQLVQQAQTQSVGDDLDSIAVDEPVFQDSLEESFELAEADLETLAIESPLDSHPLPLDFPLHSFDAEAGGIDDALNGRSQHAYAPSDASISTARPVDVLPGEHGRGYRASPFESLAGGIVERALEECELLTDLGRFTEARSILRGHLENLPNHPLIIDALRAIDAIVGPDTEPPLPDDFMVEAPHSWANLDSSTYPSFPTGGFPALREPGGHSPLFSERESSLPESAPPTPQPTAPANAADHDARTNYELGVAYMQLGQHNDAVVALTYAARDPRFECLCHSMIGTLYLQVGDLDSAIRALHDALKAPERTREQDLAIGYELGDAYELKGMPEQAWHFFDWLRQIDPYYADPRGSIHERLQRVR